MLWVRGSAPRFSGCSAQCLTQSNPAHLLLCSNIGDGGNREGPDTHWLPRPDWSAWREPSFGHGTLDLLNSTHAQWRWVRNKDSVTAVDAADAVTLVRSECHMDRGAVDRAAAAA